MNTTGREPDNAVPGAGQDVSDATEPAEEYELDQLTNERDATAGKSLDEQIEESGTGADQS